MQKHYDEKHCTNVIMCALCGFKASTVGGLRVHSARKHNAGKNAVKLNEGKEKSPEEAHDETRTKNNTREVLANNAIKLIEGNGKIPEEEIFESHDKTSTNNSDENLANNAIVSVEKDNSMPNDGDIDSTTFERLDVKELVNATFGNELKKFPVNSFYSIINTPCLEYTESAKPSANRPYDDKIIGVDNIKGAMYDSVNNTVMKNHPSITAEGT